MILNLLGGYPGDYVAIAKRSGDKWFIGVMNNSIGKSVDLKLIFCLQAIMKLKSGQILKNLIRNQRILKKSV